MVKIRLARRGAKKKPFYHIVVVDCRKKRDGGSIELVGFYNPFAKKHEEDLRFASDRIDYWCGQGAKLSKRVASLLKKSMPSPSERVTIS